MTEIKPDRTELIRGALDDGDPRGLAGLLGSLNLDSGIRDVLVAYAVRAWGLLDDDQKAQALPVQADNKGLPTAPDGKADPNAGLRVALGGKA